MFFVSYNPLKNNNNSFLNRPYGGAQFGKFFGVSLISAIINITVATVIVDFVSPMAGLNAETWALVCSVAGSAVALVFSFVGFRMAVFDKNKTA